MGNKVDISEVNELSHELGSAAGDIIAALDSIKSNIEQINAMDSFSGKAASNAKNYFNELHGSVIDNFQELFLKLETNLDNHINVFGESVDSSSTAIIDSNYLNETEGKVDLEYTKLRGYHQSIESTIQKVSDISSVSAPELYSVTSSKREVEDVIIELDKNLSNFTKEGKSRVANTKEFLHYIEKTIAAAGTEKGEARFNDFKSGTAKNELLALNGFVLGLQRVNTAVTGLTSSRAIAKAATNQGLSVTTYTKNGKVTYRITATEDALKALAVQPDAHARKALNKKKKGGNPKAHWNDATKLKYQQNAPMNYYDKKTGKQIWSKTGTNLINKHPAIEALNDKASIKEKAKTVAKATGKGAVEGLKDTVNVKGIANSGVVKGSTKALGPLGAGLSYYSNYHNAQADGLSGKEAHSRTVVDTTVDVAVSGAVQAGSVALFTVAIPIPGVGTAVGVIAGLTANWALNQGFGKSDKSVMDRAKGAIHKIKGWFS
ncbi:T7SS effector LXG polymorphic toxin [Oceanobacillus saliphilus]|uniref:T7SS effector LXG polymorphic toxin n=1 Tax=Oceanobacillus saliphilus TaxID=2925834 RepID=UPI00201D3A49